VGARGACHSSPPLARDLPALFSRCHGHLTRSAPGSDVPTRRSPSSGGWPAPALPGRPQHVRLGLLSRDVGHVTKWAARTCSNRHAGTVAVNRAIFHPAEDWAHTSARAYVKVVHLRTFGFVSRPRAGAAAPQ
jgi:hypothetical protein